MKLYACGTVPWEFVSYNAGPIEFYCSANALRDDQRCTDQCGVLEFEVEQRRVVRRSKIGRCKSAGQLQIEECITVPLADKLVAETLAATKGDSDLAWSALTRALAHFKLESRKKRREKRLKK